jgi:transposase
VPQNHFARLVNKVVESLDTSDIENKYSNLGQNTYHPKILIKLLFYGYAIGERSGRMISRRTETDTAYIYLAQMYKPDFRTINDFRKNHLEELSRYFVDIIRLCKELGLVKIGQINIDGTKIRANAANRLTKTKDDYEKWLKRIDKKIKDILEEADQTDTKEDILYGDKRGDELPDDINTEEKLKKKLEKVINRFKKDKEKINLTDPDARFMKSDDGKINTAYNCQTAVTENQLIVASDVIQDANDRTALEPMVKAAEKNLKEPVKEIAADSGYSSYDNYEYLSKNNKTGYIPDQNFTKIKTQKYNEYRQEDFKYDKTNNLYICPEGKKLLPCKVRKTNSVYRRWRQTIYKACDCPVCRAKPYCTKQPQRTIARDDRRGLLEQMRNRLLSKEGRHKYLKRLYTIEPVFGNIKHNLGYRYFLLRTLKKVKAEFKLMCIGHNLKKMHLLLALSA